MAPDERFEIRIVSMEMPVGGNSFQQDRPGTRLRIVLQPEGDQRPSRVRVAFSSAFKLIVATVAGVFCVAIASYAPVGGPSITAFVPPRCTLLIQAPSGAALHRALLDSPAFNELLDDADVGAFVESLGKNQPPPNADNESSEATKHSIRVKFDTEYAKLPWPVSALIPPNASGFYPFVGGECAVALEHVDDTATSNGKPVKKGVMGALIFTRFSGSLGHLARLGLAFFHGSKNVEIFDLGGGLIAIGINGARPAFEAHAPPMVVSTHSAADASEMPLVRVSFSPKSFATAPSKDVPLDMNDETIGHLFEVGVPESVLKALVKPPAVGDMLNWKTPPALARVNLFAGPDGSFIARGRMEGDVPSMPLQGAASTHRTGESFADFSPGGPMAEFVLPIDLRACFLRYVEGSMKLVKDADGLTKGQRLWGGRFQVLFDDRVDLDASFWPAIGHVAMLQIHEAKKDEGATPMGTIKAWFPSDIKSNETYFAAADLARARWDYVFDAGERISIKTQFVKRFRDESETRKTEGDRFVLATGKINAPAWSIGPNGLRITTDAGAFALIKGPVESDFISPPKALDAYRIRLDGPRMASTVESLVTLAYDDLEYDLGSQKFLEQHSDRKLIIRLANKCSCLLGKLALEIVPDATGAELNGSLKPASMSNAVKTPGESVQPNVKKETKKADDDDAPPPPPSN